MAIAAKFQSLLDNCQEMAFSHLRPLMDCMFENADVALLDFAEKAESNTSQAIFFEAMNEVRTKRRAIEQHFFTELKNSFSAFPTKPDNQIQDDEPNNGFDTLSLVDTDEVETYVASQNASSKLASRIMEHIFALKQRLAVINSGNSIEENQIPGGPAWLATSFQHAVEQLELQNKVRLVFIALFDKYVLSQANSMFGEYNKRLIDADILPHLRYEVRKQAGGIEIIEHEVNADDDPQAYTETATPAQAGGQSPSDLGDELFGRICDLMSIRRSTQTGANADASASSAKVSPIRTHDGNIHSTLVNQINSLQANIQNVNADQSSADFIENIEIDENLIQTLQGTIASEREHIFGMIDRRQLPAADNNIIELVGMMFEYMLQEEDLPNIVKALLSRLHTPLLKVAVVDKTLFTYPGHAARLLLNEMTAAGKRWVDESAIDRGAFPKMQVIVDRVLLEFKENVELFDDLLEDFGSTINELLQRAERIELRTTEAASGQEKLQTARTRAQKEVQTLTQARPVNEATQDFLHLIWADKLTFVLLRNEQGDGSPAWQETIQLTERIIDFSATPKDKEQRKLRHQQLDSLQQEIREATGTLQKANKEKLLIALFDAQTQVLDAEAEPVGVVIPIEQKIPAEIKAPEKPSLSPEQQTMLERLKDVPFGTWFEFQKPGKRIKRAKLSWRSTITEKFMFVDQMGVKASVIAMHDLADSMIDGSVRIAKTEKQPFVDRALKAIHRILDHAA
ncbi:hypothetical protein MNBD_GAMMA13-514 [hydrothermal vent metagenome]|uniref:Thymidine phosphorylase n=1 Tax=hydrothermal vent metagenome TaxID=652676 RepID=A0A3B0XZG2_9ZZZZ